MKATKKLEALTSTTVAETGAINHYKGSFNTLSSVCLKSTPPICCNALNKEPGSSSWCHLREIFLAILAKTKNFMEVDV